ncbi:MAG TPA: MDR family MFS transporter [Novosphingobium sp.]|nr:MDR family MFS transporter [Novosphingobium sp.]
MTQYPTGLKRFLITAPIMMGVTLVALDMTIANVALPHMQASLSASQEQIFWVLTSYLIASAIATPLSGWLANRFGRKNVMLASVTGFTVASVLCGVANDLQTIVFARIMQGAFGAGLMPLTQAILLDINAPENRLKAMAVFSMGSLLGPMIGPSLGGYLTDIVSWRWVFFINIPFGILAAAGILTWDRERDDAPKLRFDWFGFATVAIALATIQLMLDRGEQVDWFDSVEIQIYAAIAGLSVYLAVVHTATGVDTFIKPQLFKDRNFATGCTVSAVVGIATFAMIPVLVVMQQTLLGHSAYHTGLLGIPRGLGSLAGMIMVSRLAKHVDLRLLMLVGLGVIGVSQAMYAGLDLYTDDKLLIVTGFINGISSGLVFVPLAAISFTTLSPVFRNEGSAMFALVRNVGNAVGISVLHRQMVHYTAESQAHLVQGIRPDNPMLDYARPDFDFGSIEALSRMEAEISRQAGMVGTVEVFWLSVVISLAVAPVVLLMRVKKNGQDDGHVPVVE